MHPQDKPDNYGSRQERRGFESDSLAREADVGRLRATRCPRAPRFNYRRREERVVSAQTPPPKRELRRFCLFRGLTSESLGGRAVGGRARGGGRLLPPTVGAALEPHKARRRAGHRAAALVSVTGCLAAAT